MTVGVIVAMGAEFRLVEALLREKKETQIRGFRFMQGKIGEQQIVLMQCGIGKVCAATGTTMMIHHFAPDRVVNTGVAGGIDDSLRVMDIVIGKEVVYHDVWCGEGNAIGQVQGMPARYAGNAALLKAALSAQTDVALREGLICSGDRFITNAEELQQIKSDFPDGLAVDMESGAIAQVCHLFGVPFLSCRIISDTPGHVENHALQYKDFWTSAPEKSFEVLAQLLTSPTL